MSNKNLLNENTVRRFMKLASLYPISDSFIKENFDDEEITESDTEEVEGGNLEETADLEEMAYAREDEEPEEDAPMDMDVEEPVEGPAEEPAGDASQQMETFAKTVAKALADAIVDASGGSVSVSVEGGDDDPAAAEPVDAMEEPSSEDEIAMDPEMEEEEEAAPMMEEESTSEIDLSEEAREEIVGEVFKRVAKRLLKAKIS